jgi:hypothetical protein
MRRPTPNPPEFPDEVEKKQQTRPAGESFLTGKMPRFPAGTKEFECKPAIYLKKMQGLVFLRRLISQILRIRREK